MIYIFDSCALITMFYHYYESRFPTLWNSFNKMVSDGNIISVKEVFREITYRPSLPKKQADRLLNWAKNNKEIFKPTDETEGDFIKEIFKIEHFRQIISVKEIKRGFPVADPFVIARACTYQGCVVTEEIFKPNGAKIPNICNHFKIGCVNLENFMKKENWVF